MEGSKEIGRRNTRILRKLNQKLAAMRTKHFILILCCVIITTIFFILLGPAGEPNDSLKSIVTHTHQQLNKLQVSNTKHKSYIIFIKSNIESYIIYNIIRFS